MSSVTPLPVTRAASPTPSLYIHPGTNFVPMAVPYTCYTFFLQRATKGFFGGGGGGGGGDKGFQSKPTTTTLVAVNFTISAITMFLFRVRYILASLDHIV